MAAQREAYTVTFDEAVGMLPEPRAEPGEREIIHVFILGTIGIPIGGDWDRSDAIELLRRADEIFVTDSKMARMGHALAVRRITPGFGWWHVETRTATEAR